MTITMIIVLAVALPAAGIIGFLFRSYLGKIKLSSYESNAQRILNDARKEAESKRKELLIEAKDELQKEN